MSSISSVARLFFVLPALLFLVAAPRVAGARSGEPSGHIEIVSYTRGARVMIDDIEVGRLPLRDPITVSPGSYTISISAPGYMTHTETVEVEPRRTVTVDVDLLAFAGVLVLSSNVDGARVRIGPRVIGEVPIIDREIPAGTHTIVVEAEGYLPSTQTVTFAAGERHDLSFVLVRDPAIVETAEDQENRLLTIWDERRPLVWSMLGVTLAGTGLVLLTTGGRTTEIYDPTRLPGGEPDVIINPRR